MFLQRFLTLVTLAAIALLPRGVHGQTTRPALPEDLVCSILAFEPGPIVYERFGHVAIRIRAASRGYDVSYDWGNFSFDDPGFFWHFILGENRYWMHRKSTREDILDDYIGEKDRTVIEQRLALDDEQKRSLLRALERQDTNANRFYAYDYYLDNCGTRVRDTIDAAVGGQLRPQLATMTGHGYRWQTERMLWSGADNKTLATLIDFLCGPRGDRPLSEWDVAFLPIELSRSLDHVTIANDDGTRRPLVAERVVLNATHSPGNDEPAAPGIVFAWPLAIGVAGAGLIVLAARFAWPLAVVGIVAWESFAAFGGVLICFMIGFTRHWALAWNQNLFHFTPVGLLIVASVLARRWRRLRLRAATIAAALSLLGAAISLSHLTPQLTVPAVALSLPLHLAVWHAVRSRASRVASPATSNLEGTVP